MDFDMANASGGSKWDQFVSGPGSVMDDMDDIVSIPEPAMDGIFFDLCRQAGLYPQSVIFRPYAQDKLADIHKTPGCSAGKPGILTFARESSAIRRAMLWPSIGP